MNDGTDVDDDSIDLDEGARYAALVETTRQRLNVTDGLMDTLAIADYEAMTRHFEGVLDLQEGLQEALRTVHEWSDAGRAAYGAGGPGPGGFSTWSGQLEMPAPRPLDLGANRDLPRTPLHVPDIDGFGAATLDNILHRIAAFWAACIIRTGGDATADSLVNEAYLRARSWRASHPDAHRVVEPQRWLTMTVQNLGLTATRRLRDTESEHVSDQGDLDDVQRRIRAREVRTILVRHGDRIWENARYLLGTTRRVEVHAAEIRASAMQAAQILTDHVGLFVVDGTETPEMAFHEVAERQPGLAQRPGEFPNSYRQRIRLNVLPWLSFQVWAAVEATADEDDDPLLVVMIWTQHKLAQQRLAHVTRYVKDVELQARLSQYVTRLEERLTELRPTPKPAVNVHGPADEQRLNPA